MPRIAILAHERESQNNPYFLRGIARLWREQGFEVVVHRGTAAPPAADLAIVHVDLTVVPDDYLALAAHFPVTLNGRLKDISKRRISRQLVTRGDGYDGPVMVKTDRNSGGLPELILERGGATRADVQELLNYRVYRSPAAVPNGLWFDARWIVERFISERRDGLYCLRTWVCLGNRETHSLSYSQEPIIKSRNVIRREVLGEVPAELQRVRQELGVDFGKFDYALVDDEVVLYDVNKTPSLGRLSVEDMLPRLLLLAEGIHAYLPASP